MGRYMKIRIGAAAVVLTLSATAAAASANISCAIDDANLTFVLEALAGRSGPIFQVQAGSSLSPKAGKPPRAIAEIPVTLEHIVQQWLWNDDLRLQVEIDDPKVEAKDAPKINYLLLTIFARHSSNDDENSYRGRYTLNIGEKTFKGRIKSCEAG